MDDASARGSDNELDNLFIKHDLLPTLIETQTRVRPSGPCIVSDGNEYTFEQLWHLVVINAESLWCHGVRQGSRVAVIAESSGAAIVAVLSIARLGAVAVPIAASLPEARIAAISEICDLTHVIGVTALSQSLLRQLSLPTIGIDMSEPTGPIQAMNHESATQLDPKSPALVVFTSGSSGKPKGVVHSHSSLSTMAFAVSDALDLVPGERNLLFASFGWAVNIIDSLATMAGGACLCIPTESEKSQGLNDVINALRATRVTLPPSVLRVMSPEKVPSLTALVLAGEHLVLDAIKPWASKVTLFWNYGSSETLMVLAGRIDISDEQSLNAGTPLACCKCSIVDDRGSPVTAEETGKLVVQSNTNFLGYMERGRVCGAKDTVCDRSSVSPGDFFTRRGQLFAHRGRIDFQIKLFGQRIDPMDVEHHLRLCLQPVDHLVVTVASLRGTAGDPMLLGVASLGHTEVTRMTAAGRIGCDFERLVKSLPPFMIPSGVLLVDSIPRLHNGKLDRKQVARLAEGMHISQLLDLRPASSEAELEQQDLALASKISVIWSKALKVSINDIRLSTSFFLLGGTSIYAMSVCHELRHLGIKIAISTIFANPTLAQLVHAITRGSCASELNSSAATTPDSSSGPADAHVHADTSSLRTLFAHQCSVQENTIEEIYPSTALQSGLLWGSEVQKGAYIAQHTFHLPSHWNQARCVSAWQQVVKEVPILRTRLVQDMDGTTYNATLRWDAAHHLPVRTFVPAEDMTYGRPLFLYQLYVDESRSALVWRWQVHHALYDRWSTHLLLEMMITAYTCHEIPSCVPFSAFAAAAMKQGTSQESKEYWRATLEDFRGSIYPPLPHDRHASRAAHVLETSLVSTKAKLHTTRATSIQAALALAMGEMRNETDIAFGMTVHGRNLRDCPGAESVVGPAIATIPRRVPIDKSSPLDDFLARLQAQAASDSDHEHCGLQNIKRICSGAEAAVSFQTLLIIQHDMAGIAGPDRDCIVEVDHAGHDCYLDYPLVFECEVSLDTIGVRVFYDVDVLSSWEVQMLVDVFRRAFDHCEHGSTREVALRDLKLTDKKAEANLLLWSMGDLHECYDCLDMRIFTNMRSWPDATALSGWDACLTYQELAQLVQDVGPRLAWRLDSVPGTVVPIAFEKSTSAVVAMLAVLHSGCAFVMLDLKLPAERIRYMVKAVGAKSILCSSRTVCLVPETDARVVVFDEVLRDAPTSLCQLEMQRSPDAPAYCIFTSGSTGDPKAVLMLHKQVTSGLEAQCLAGLYPRDSRLLQFASYSFDTSIADIFATLLAGGCVCIPEEENLLSRLAEQINRFDANVVDLTPSVARTLHPDDVPNLKVMRLGGEAMHDWHVRTWGDRCLQSTYGPSETCVQCCTMDMTRDTSNALKIGKGIGCHTWVLDTENHNLLTPLGAIGELAIQGPGVAAGYLRDPSKTQAVFLENAPWLAAYGVQCGYPTYLTGDLVKFDSDGNLVFVGRRDGQIKIRGQRVELGEIENVLQTVPSIQQAVVCCPSVGHLASQLVAIVQPHSGCIENEVSWTRAVKSTAAEFLPAYMIPNHVVIRDEVPLMPSGKIDRKTTQLWLEQVSLDDVKTPSTTYTPDDTESSAIGDTLQHYTKQIIEQVRILRSWAAHFRDDTSICIDQSWTSIGLDSITLVSLQKWIVQELHAEISIRTLLGLNSIRGLALHLSQCEDGDSGEDDLANFQELVDTGVRRLCERAPEHPQRVFLTGVSSLVGINILIRVLSLFPKARVLALMRCRDASAGMTRLSAKLDLMKQWRKEFQDRLEIWPGDLIQPQFGLSTGQIAQLSGATESALNIDTVIHAGASVDWVGGFDTLKRVNIDASLDLVEYTKNSPSIRRHVHVSGGPQWSPDETADMALTKDRTAIALSQSNAYGQTKIIASTIIQKAAARNADIAAKVAVVRPGLVIGSRIDGIPNVDDYIWRVVMGCRRIGAYPWEAAQGWVYLCAADDFAQYVVDHLFTGPQVFETRIHDGLHIDKFWDLVNEELETPLVCLDYHEWLALLNDDIAKYQPDQVGETHPCLPVLHMLESDSSVLGAPAPSTADSLWKQEVEIGAAEAVRENIRYLVGMGCLSSTRRAGALIAFDRKREEAAYG